MTAEIELLQYGPLLLHYTANGVLETAAKEMLIRKRMKYDVKAPLFSSVIRGSRTGVNAARWKRWQLV